MNRKRDLDGGGDKRIWMKVVAMRYFYEYGIGIKGGVLAMGGTIPFTNYV